MRLLAPLLGLAAAIVLAVPAHSDPGVDDATAVNNPAFLASLRQAGITYNDPDHAIAAARAVCGWVHNGKTGLEVVRGLMTANPEFTTDGAAQFTAIAANAYCPHQLTPVDTATK